VLLEKEGNLGECLQASMQAARDLEVIELSLDHRGLLDHFAELT
jgi:hypothetical protein